MKQQPSATNRPSTFIWRPVGGNCGSLSNCYSSGHVSGQVEAGGLTGVNYCSSISNCFWDNGTQTHGVTYSIGAYQTGTIINVAGLPTEQMQTRSTFTSAGWDFVEIWNIGENQTYPYLRRYPVGYLNHKGGVDFLDLAIFAGYWLEGAGQ